jgi:hypothetical protein
MSQFANDIELEEHVRRVMIEICAVMWNHGHRKIPVAPILELLGCTHESSQTHADDYFELDVDFEKYLAEYLILEEESEELTNIEIPPGTVIQ